MRKANKQILSTRTLCPNPDALGVLIYINEFDETLNSQLFQHKICTCFAMKDEEGNFVCSQIARVVLINSCFSNYKGDKNKFPIIYIDNDLSYPVLNQGMDSYLDSLFRQFFAQLNIRYSEEDIANINLNDFLNNTCFIDSKSEERWRVFYRSHRFMEKYSDEELFLFGQNQFQVFFPNFLKDHNKPRTEEKILIRAIILCIFFLEEAYLRLIDMKKFGPYIQEVTASIYGRKD